MPERLTAAMLRVLRIALRDGAIEANHPTDDMVRGDRARMRRLAANAPPMEGGPYLAIDFRPSAPWSSDAYRITPAGRRALEEATNADR
jgi:hypothetical protein